MSNLSSASLKYDDEQNVQNLDDLIAASAAYQNSHILRAFEHAAFLVAVKAHH
jgi:hypothetical protein